MTPVRFSQRTAWDFTPNAVTAALAERRGADLIDLTESNPTRVGFDALTRDALASLASPGAARYEPEARGIAVARDAVRGYYAARDVSVDDDRVVLCASTSEAYGWLFKLLCDPGDSVLVARPSYPLFDDLARLEEVTLTPFPMHLAGRWTFDLDALEAAVTSRTRAVALVHPNNPTGSFVSRDERDAVAALCRRRGLALIVDEVFLDCARGPDPDRAPSFAGFDGALTFTLSGLSKTCLLPQLKLAWIVVSGPDAQRADALRRLEHIADTWLSVGAPVQHAAAAVLARCDVVQATLRARLEANHRALAAALRGTAATVLDAEGGWYRLVRLPATMSEDAWCERMLDAGVRVQPGYFFDVEGGAHVVLSLLPRPEDFVLGVERVSRAVREETA